MKKINLILESSLFTNNNLRDLLRKFIESQLTNEFNKKIDLINLDTSAILNNDHSLRDEIAIALRNSKIYVNFIHNASDKIFQNLVFLFLVYSYSKFPNNHSWIKFLNENEVDKSKIVQNGITEAWSQIQSNWISQKLNGEIKQSLSESDDLPF
jgi:hypothetical protein